MYVSIILESSLFLCSSYTIKFVVFQKYHILNDFIVVNLNANRDFLSTQIHQYVQNIKRHSISHSTTVWLRRGWKCGNQTNYD